MATSYTFCVPSQLNVFDGAENVPMTPWKRLNDELAKRKIAWSTFGSSLGLTKQNIDHWKSRGIPSRHIRAAADYLGWSTEQLEFGDDHQKTLGGAPPPITTPVTEPTSQRQPTTKAQVLAEEFDRIKDEDLRLAVLTKCLDEIRQAQGPPLSRGLPAYSRTAARGKSA